MGRGLRQPTTSQPTTSNSTETADDYVTAQRIVVPETPALCKLMFSYASVKRSLNGYELVPRKYNSVSTTNRVKSAVVFLHREAKVELSTELNAMMKEYVSGYKRKFAQLKESGESPTLLFGYNEKERFSSWLTKTCAANEDDIAGFHRTLSNLHHSHPLLLPPVWLSGSLALLASEVLGGTLHNPVSKLTATGIPPHIPLYNQLRALESNLGALANRVDEGFNAIPHQLRIVMDATISSTTSVTMDQLHTLTVPDKNAVFEASFASLYGRLFASAGAAPLGNRRIIEMSYHTVYDAINKQ
ncbi:hypothetical protein H257_05236 [Aphanomyces astaci]|uniref:Uncharacterized protein n=1 Tax=Aphanomyces astaci TaxID=112090 RepID=W4GTM3_APHAT|nr:hypothetical protein H257_05236 [Aphanomyces astaci]ETV82666.1 hypothetical protein H257_05236 [Aphanomyces astaci]|eukprot:XP_009828335.1 hypothetical protein H257_05236 [Aphanomyces astaci]